MNGLNEITTMEIVEELRKRKECEIFDSTAEVSRFTYPPDDKKVIIIDWKEAQKPVYGC